jgi:ABC-type nitrate/sulfonate/bicarbonate transport system ATPase subunit
MSLLQGKRTFLPIVGGSESRTGGEVSIDDRPLRDDVLKTRVLEEP